jgi:hypothetical protein
MSWATLGGSPSIYGSGYASIRSQAPKNTGLWGCFNRVVSYVTDTVRAPATWLAAVIAKKFFLPLTAQDKQIQLRKEEIFRAKFLKGEPVPPLDNHKILVAYKEPVERSYVVLLKDGRNVTLTCSIWETKPRDGAGVENVPYYNLAYLAGNHSTNQSAIAGVYSYLDAMLKQLEEQNHFQGARAFVITAYNITNEAGELHIPGPFHNGGFIREEGLIIKEALCAIQDDFQCGIHEVAAHSLGGILLAAAMAQFTEKDQRYIPKHFFFDRCPWSIEKAAKNVFLGWLLVPIAKLLGVSLDIADQIWQFFQLHKQYIQENQIRFFVADVEQDHRFDKAQLGAAQQIKDLVEAGIVTRLFFDFVQQLHHEMSHHGMIPSFIYGAYLKEEDYDSTETFAATGRRKFLGDFETLSTGIVKLSMHKAQKIFDEKRQVVEVA